jgi:hypothetical protein
MVGLVDFSEGSNLKMIFKGSSVVNRTRIWFDFNGPCSGASFIGTNVWQLRL